MQGDYTVFLTIDEDNKIWIETFEFETESITQICEKVFLCDFNHEHIETKIDHCR